MRATSFEQGLEKGLEKGREEGRIEGQRELLRELLVQRFGALSRQTDERLRSLSTKQVRALFKKGIRAKSLGDLGL